jgi:hypothetical protein
MRLLFISLLFAVLGLYKLGKCSTTELYPSPGPMSLTNEYKACTHHHNQEAEYFCHSKSIFASLAAPLLPLESIRLISISTLFTKSAWETESQCVDFHAWFPSLSIMHWKFIHWLHVSVVCSFVLLSSRPSFRCVTDWFSTQQLMNIWVVSSSGW